MLQMQLEGVELWEHVGTKITAEINPNLLVEHNKETKLKKIIHDLVKDHLITHRGLVRGSQHGCL